MAASVLVTGFKLFYTKQQQVQLLLSLFKTQFSATETSPEPPDNALLRAEVTDWCLQKDKSLTLLFLPETEPFAIIDPSNDAAQPKFKKAVQRELSRYTVENVEALLSIFFQRQIQTFHELLSNISAPQPKSSSLGSDKTRESKRKKINKEDSSSERQAPPSTLLSVSGDHFQSTDLQLLAKFQDDLFAHLWHLLPELDANMAEEISQLFQAYFTLILDKSSQVIKMSQEFISMRQTRENAAALLHLLNSTFVGKLLPGLLVSLSALMEKLAIQSNLTQIAGALASLLTSIDTLYKLCSLDDAVSTAAIPYRKSEPLVVETNHPYHENVVKNVSMPGAAFLQLKFDPKCCTSVDDRLQLSCKPDKRQLLSIESILQNNTSSSATSLGGADDWPKDAFYVPGSSASFAFESLDINTNKWGWSCKIVAFTLEQPIDEKNETVASTMSWLRDFERTVACLVSRGVSLLIKGSKLSDEIKLNKWLDSILFCGGLENELNSTERPHSSSSLPSSPSRGEQPIPMEHTRTFLEDFIYGKGEGKVLFEMAHAERAVIAAMLKHTNLVVEAIACARNAEYQSALPPRIQLICRLSHKIKHWLINKHQRARMNSSDYSSKHTKESYKRLADAVVMRASFLLEVVGALVYFRDSSADRKTGGLSTNKRKRVQFQMSSSITLNNSSGSVAIRPTKNIDKRLSTRLRPQQLQRIASVNVGLQVRKRKELTQEISDSRKQQSEKQGRKKDSGFFRLVRSATLSNVHEIAKGDSASVKRTKRGTAVVSPNWNFLIETMQALHALRKQATKEESEPEEMKRIEAVCNEVLNFIQAGEEDVPLPMFKRVITQRKERAFSFLTAFKSLHSLLRSVELTPAKVDLLWRISDSLRSVNALVTNRRVDQVHYLNCIQSSGKMLVAAVEEALLPLLSLLASFLEAHRDNTPLVLLVLNSLTMFFTKASDAKMLIESGVLEFLIKLIYQQRDDFVQLILQEDVELNDETEQETKPRSSKRQRRTHRSSPSSSSSSSAKSTTKTQHADHEQQLQTLESAWTLFLFLARLGLGYQVVSDHDEEEAAEDNAMNVVSNDVHDKNNKGETVSFQENEQVRALQERIFEMLFNLLEREVAFMKRYASLLETRYQQNMWKETPHSLRNDPLNNILIRNMDRFIFDSLALLNSHFDSSKSYFLANQNRGCLRLCSFVLSLVQEGLGTPRVQTINLRLCRRFLPLLDATSVALLVTSPATTSTPSSSSEKKKEQNSSPAIKRRRASTKQKENEAQEKDKEQQENVDRSTSVAAGFIPLLLQSVGKAYYPSVAVFNPDEQLDLEKEGIDLFQPLSKQEVQRLRVEELPDPQTNVDTKVCELGENCRKRAKDHRVTYRHPPKKTAKARKKQIENGEALYEGDPVKASELPPGKVYRKPWNSGFSMLSLAEEVISLIRVLLQPSAPSMWKDSIATLLRECLERLPTIILALSRCEQTPHSTEHVWFALAALCIIGGNKNLLRKGARVEIHMSEGVVQKGRILSYSPQMAIVPVKVEGSPVTMECEVSKLRPFADTPTKSCDLTSLITPLLSVVGAFFGCPPSSSLKGKEKTQVVENLADRKARLFLYIKLRSFSFKALCDILSNHSQVMAPLLAQGWTNKLAAFAAQGVQKNEVLSTFHLESASMQAERLLHELRYRTTKEQKAVEENNEKQSKKKDKASSKKKQKQKQKKSTSRKSKKKKVDEDDEDFTLDDEPRMLSNRKRRWRDEDADKDISSTYASSSVASVSTSPSFFLPSFDLKLLFNQVPDGDIQDILDLSPQEMELEGNNESGKDEGKDKTSEKSDEQANEKQVEATVEFGPVLDRATWKKFENGYRSYNYRMDSADNDEPPIEELPNTNNNNVISSEMIDDEAEEDELVGEEEPTAIARRRRQNVIDEDEDSDEDSDDEENGGIIPVNMIEQDLPQLQKGMVLRIRKREHEKNQGEDIPCAGKTGYVMLKMKRRIQVQFYDTETGILEQWWFSNNDIHAPSKYVYHPDDKLFSAKKERLQTIGMQADSQLSVIYARQIMGQVLMEREQYWMATTPKEPRTNTSHLSKTMTHAFGSNDRLIKFLQLLAAKHITLPLIPLGARLLSSDWNKIDSYSSKPTEPVVQDGLAAFTPFLEELISQPVRLNKSSTTPPKISESKEDEAESQKWVDLWTDVDPLFVSLVDYCKLNLRSMQTFSTEVKKYRETTEKKAESHQTFFPSLGTVTLPKCGVTAKVSVGGGGGIAIIFNNYSSHKTGAEVHFFKDPSCTELVKRLDFCSHNTNTPVRLNCSEVWVKHVVYNSETGEEDKDQGDYSISFAFLPNDLLVLDDWQALSPFNFTLSFWIVQLLYHRCDDTKSFLEGSDAKQGKEGEGDKDKQKEKEESSAAKPTISSAAAFIYSEEFIRLLADYTLDRCAPFNVITARWLIRTIQNLEQLCYPPTADAKQEPALRKVNPELWTLLDELFSGPLLKLYHRLASPGELWRINPRTKDNLLYCSALCEMVVALTIALQRRRQYRLLEHSNNAAVDARETDKGKEKELNDTHITTKVSWEEADWQKTIGALKTNTRVWDMLEIGYMLRHFNKRESLPLTVFAPVLANKEVVIESNHPLEMDTWEQYVEIPGAASLEFSSDPRFDINWGNRITFSPSGFDDDKAIELRGTLNFSLQSNISSEGVFIRFTPSSKTIHTDSSCAHCGKVAIEGICYRCVTCTDPYNLCSECESKGEYQHPAKHVFAKLRGTISGSLSTGPLSFDMVEEEKKEESEGTSDGASASAQCHKGAVCRVCRAEDFAGARFECGHCNYTLCETCETKNSWHQGSSHIFLKFPRPLSPQQQLVQPLLSQTAFGGPWGFRYVIKPILSTESIEKALLSEVDSTPASLNKDKMEEDKEEKKEKDKEENDDDDELFSDSPAENIIVAMQTVNQWFSEVPDSLDEQIVQYVEQILTHLDVQDLSASLHPSELLMPNSNDLLKYPLLSGISLELLRKRYTLLRYYNTKMMNAITSGFTFDNHQISSSTSTNGSASNNESNEPQEQGGEACPWAHPRWRSIAQQACQARHKLFMMVKLKHYNNVLNNRSSGGYYDMPHIHLSRQDATDDPEKQCLLLQAYKQLQPLRPDSFRCTRRQPFKVKLIGERATDAGGPYRECFTQICTDLKTVAIQSEQPLFIESPNTKHKIGKHQGCLIPNPSANSPFHLSLFNFVGRLLGMALRSGSSTTAVALDLAPLVWKLLVGDGVRITLEDLEGVDLMGVKSLETLRNLEKEGITEEMFGDLIFLTFTTNSADGREVELVEGGADIPVTWENREEYVELVQAYKTQEFEGAIRSMREGLASITPSSAVCLFTAPELERLVCGDRDIDVEMLKRNTHYGYGISATAKEVVMFWNVLSEFTPEQKRKFLVFVWGRESIPATSAEFTQKFNLEAYRTPRGQPVDNFLPKAHTCSFGLDLPAYTTKEALRSKLLYAISVGVEYDLDG
ncbi:putative ubiquitin-protein ligase [Balamuthia mandrillaris]